MSKEMKVALVSCAVGVVVAAVGVTAYLLVGGDGDDGQQTAGERAVPTGPPSAAEVKATANEFLTAWSKGDAAQAASHTDDSAAARTALTGYRKDAHLDKVDLTPGKRTGTKVPFKVSAQVFYKGKSKPVAYASELTVVRDEKTGEPVVDWKPDVLHPDLREGDRLRTGASGNPPIKAVDRDGAELTKAEYPSLGGVLDSLREKYGKKAGGDAGVELQIVRGKPAEDGAKGEDDSSDDKGLPDKTLATLSKGTPGTLKTTISATAQAAAEKEAGARQQASVVVLKPSTGEILAAANSRPSGFNVAFQGSLAPGSTMKIVTASMLLEKNLAGIDKKHPCPKYASYGGWKFQNVEKFKIDGGTFRDSFAASCNTAFITQAKKLGDGDLTKQAQEVFGLGRGNWSSGVPTFDGAVPAQKDAQKAASLIGQGGVRMSPLNVASYISTAKTGTFKQPYVISPTIDKRTLATAPRKLNPKAHSQLRTLLNHTATSGSAAEAMASLSGDIGGKTGSAEVDGQKKPNGWFAAWHGDMAAAAVVQQGGRGGESAGPLVASVLGAAG
ncbi:Stage V sporulation protein D [Streptomyces sp. YIM 130001]|uniref:penicillin-binding transpeptidase domain-containing protein n=1 Tax=Streptomyces sp. YIM 130001 TaxID=2259644 RepID=UPI000E657BEA|nr:penicillin-binding transpeptidase domain-containing protein [Streptomyces sp. YIM 130001]RII15001.1 Stage V sporulation protein D [Streptomyces sp. YIM 130001]